MKIVQLFSQDLLIVSQLRPRLLEHGWQLRTDKLQSGAPLAEGVDWILLDLAAMDASALSTLKNSIDRWRTEKPELRIWAYGPHVDRDLLRAAQDAGCNVVVPRSRLLSELEKHLTNPVKGGSLEDDLTHRRKGAEGQ